RYDDFDRLKDMAIRTRYKTLERLGSASSVTAGMLMSTPDKVIWGKVVQSDTANASAGTAYYANDYGTIANKALAAAVKSDAIIYFYDEGDTDLKVPLFKALVDEGKGIF